MKYELHYAKLDLQGDIPCYQLNEGIELNGFLLAESQTHDCVYLVSLFEEVYVTDNILHVINFIEKYYFKPNELNAINIPTEIIDEVNKFIKDFKINPIKLFVQEYHSFKDAYKVALNMQEIKPLCY